MTPLRLLLLPIAAGTMFAAPAANAQLITDPSYLTDLMEKEGSPAQNVDTETDEPFILSFIDGDRFGLFFLDCTSGKNCQSMYFKLIFFGARSTLERTNAWNKTHRYARAVIDDEGNPAIAMDIVLDKSGISPGMFERDLEIWRTAVREFKAFMAG